MSNTQTTEPEPLGGDPLIGPFLQNPASDAMTVAWIRADGKPCLFECESESAADAADRRSHPVPPLRPVGQGSDRYYEIRLTGLKPATRYAYTLRCPDAAPRTSHFRTFPAGGDRLSFICYGDNKSGHEMHRRLARRFDLHSPDFILHTGDITDHGRYEEYRPYFFDPLRDVIDHIPILVARGNHEGDGTGYRQVYSLPEGEPWFSLDCANAHVIVLDTNGWRRGTQETDVRRMYAWCEADLRRTQALWRIAIHHEPSFDLGYRKDDWGLKDFLPLMRRHGVDLTFSAHAHGYQRLHPMVARGENEDHPITHIITAGGGAAIAQRSLDASDFLAFQARRNNYVAVSIAGDRLTAEVLADNGERLDGFELHKPGGRYAPSVLSQALWAHDYGKPGALIRPYANMKA